MCRVLLLAEQALPHVCRLSQEKRPRGRLSSPRAIGRDAGLRRLPLAAHAESRIRLSYHHTLDESRRWSPLVGKRRGLLVHAESTSPWPRRPLSCRVDNTRKILDVER